MASEHVGNGPTATESASTAAERKPAEAQAFSDKLAKRSLPNTVERAAIKIGQKEDGRLFTEVTSF